MAISCIIAHLLNIYHSKGIPTSQGPWTIHFLLVVTVTGGTFSMWESYWNWEKTNKKQWRCTQRNYGLHGCIHEECERWPRNVFEVINIQENVQRYLGVHTIKYMILAIDTHQHFDIFNKKEQFHKETRTILYILYLAQHGNQHKDALAWIIYHDPCC